MRRILALLPALLALAAVPASAQTAQKPDTSSLVTKADLQATRAQISQKISAQNDDLAALRQQLLSLKAQAEVLDRRINAMQLPTAPKPKWH